MFPPISFLVGYLLQRRALRPGGDGAQNITTAQLPHQPLTVHHRQTTAMVAKKHFRRFLDRGMAMEAVTDMEGESKKGSRIM